MPETVLAAQMYTVREFTQKPAELAKAYAKVAKIGYKAVQASGHGPIDAGEMKKVLDDNGLTCCATHDSYKRFTDKLDELIADHQLWGCKYPGLGALPKDMQTPEGYVEFARNFDGIGARLREAGLTFAYHNHNFEFEKMPDGRLGLEVIMEESQPANVTIEIDTHWVQRGGGDPAAWIGKCSGRIPLLHLKDFSMKGREPQFAEIGEGNLDWPGILKAADGAGVRWYIVEQDTCPGDPFASLKKSYENLREMGLE